MEILSGEAMRRVDRRAIEAFGIPSLDLMEAAGSGVASALLERWAEALTGRTLVVCGKGNNGGDGLVAARHLAAHGMAVKVLLLVPPDRLQGDAAAQFKAADDAGLEIGALTDATDWDAFASWFDDATLIVDAVLGTGVRGGARSPAREAIERMNAAAAPTVSIDVPSGLNADTHAVEGPAVEACHTLTLCRPKPCLVLDPAARFAGSWSVVSIGIPDAAVQAEQPRQEWIDQDAARRLLPRRAADSHKGDYGHVLTVAGGHGKSGAAVLTCRGALRAGAGLVTAAVPESSLALVAPQQPELMTAALPENRRGNLSRRAADAILELADGRDALAIGPGLGTDPGTRKAVHAVLADRTIPAVLDADGLNAFAVGRKDAPPLLAGRYPLVLTPHPAEAARLLGQDTATVQRDRTAAALRLAETTGAITVLKGHRTLVARRDGHVAINASGNPGMATGGSGDVLTGILAALLARGLSDWDAARLAVWAHGAAGDRAARKTGVDGLLATDLIRALPRVLRDLVAADPGDLTR